MREVVLIVDDEPTLRAGLKDVLEMSGVEVEVAGDLATAERMLAGRRFDLVLADLSLAGTLGREGLELVRHIKRSGVSSPVVIFTAHGSDSVREQAIAAGAVDLWSKSIAIEELIARVLTFRS